MFAPSAARSVLPALGRSRLSLAVHLALVSLVLMHPGRAALAQASAAAKDAKSEEKTLSTVRVSADSVPAEVEAKTTYQAVTSTIGKGKQALRDIPQSVTVVTEKLMDDRNIDTLRDALHMTSGITFLAAEGGEEDIRLRGFSLQQAGDIFVDGMRDPAYYERDTFNYDRLEVLRGSASMLFGRGSTGGAVNQVSKQAFLLDQNEVDLSYGTGNYWRTEADLNLVTGKDSAFRLTAMKNQADNKGNGSSVDKEGAAGNFRYGIGMADEFMAGVYYLKNRNGINYGLPWVTPVAGAVDRDLMKVDPSSYYGMGSDYSNSDVVHGTLGHTHRFGDGGELKTGFRAGSYKRDQRASAVRFAAAASQPNKQTALGDNFSDNTVLTRGVNNKIMDLDNQILQSDYTNKFKLLGMEHAITTGVDFNHEFFTGYTAVLPTGVTLTKPNTVVGDKDGEGWVNESLRSVRRSSQYDSLAAGAYMQDLLQVAENWKLLGGLRWDYMNADYKTYDTATLNAGNITASRGRHDSLPSERFGVLYQPTTDASFHASYGTSFNTSGDTYRFDAVGANTPPEKSRNIEIGSKTDFFGGNLSTRAAIFHSTKYNERNRDEETVNSSNYVLSGERYAKGMELDVAGRISKDWEAYVSYSWIPVAKISKGTSGQGETVGSRPGLTPKHSATLWSTYQLAPDWRLGGGVNARSDMNPQLVDTFVADGYLTYDAMVEYRVITDLTFKLNASNLTNKLYADSIYRGHYVPGAGRTVQLTAAYKF